MVQDKKNKKSFYWISKISIFVLSFVLTTAILLFEKDRGVGEGQYKIGEPAPRTLFSPLEIAYKNEEATTNLQRIKRAEVPYAYFLDPLALQASTKKIDQFFERLLELRASETSEQKPDLKDLPLKVSETSVKHLYDDSKLEDTRKTIQLLLEQTYQEGLLAPDDRTKLFNEGVDQISIMRDDQTESVTRVAELRLVPEASEFAEKLLPQSIARSRNAKRAIMELFGLVIFPNLKFDASETAFRQEEAMLNVEPVIHTIKKDELLVQRGRLVTADEKERIDQIQRKLAENEAIDKFSGISLLVFLAYLLAFLYLMYFERKTFASNNMIILMHTIFLISVVICKLIIEWPNSSAYLMPTALAPLLLALLMPFRVGILGSVVMAIFAALLTGFNSDVVLATLISGIAGTFSTLRIRKRIEFLRLGIAVGLTYFLVLFAFQIYLEYSALEATQVSALGLANGLLITIPLCFFMIPILESVFNLVTDLTLLELSDLNHPLLKRMVVEAPGTYHHSLVVSTLSEAACEKIGANPLLARVGCYFHDIGKIAKAEYFTENQRGIMVNKHKVMTPTMSSLIIMEHVKAGIELGKQHKLKKRILDFIPEHHGTQVIYYFYRKALDNAKPGEVVSADDFRYSGPKPQSRETAVSLLADSTEAASRSLKDPTPESIRQLVRKIINDKFIDGQLDECDLTLRDLHRIQESFVHNLMAIYHTRVTYPTKPESPDKTDLFKGDTTTDALQDGQGQMEY